MSFSIYVVSSGDLVKIGMTGDLERRLAQYRTHNPGIGYHYKCTSPGEFEAKLVEGMAQTLLRGFKSRDGEWFKCSVPVAAHAVSMATKVVDSLVDRQSELMDMEKRVRAQEITLAEMFSGVFDIEGED